MRRSKRLLPCALVLVTATGCIHGPSAFRTSHALHNEALRARIDEELLLNLVRLRYRASPLFLQVGSVVTQFEVTGSLGASGSLAENGPGSLGLAAGVGWSEQPTYTFTPLQDDEFVRRLLAPIEIEVVALLQRSGWSIERVLRLTVQNFGGLDNATSASGPTPERAPVFADFLRLTKSLRELQRQGRIQLAFEEQKAELSPPIAGSSVLGADLVSAAENDFRFEPVAGSPSQLVLTRDEKAAALHLSPDARDRKELQEITRLLGLSPDRTRYRIVAGAPTGESGDPGAKETIRVSTRSLLGALFYLSHGIDVPRDHIDAGLVTVTRDAEGGDFDWQQLTGDVFRVKTSPRHPGNAAIAVPYRGHWFYVEDTDLASKSTFALLLELFNMSANTSLEAAPTLTLPVGG